MKKKIIFLILLGIFQQLPCYLIAQPAPGDTGLGAASGNVVGGGSGDIDGGIWMLLVFSLGFLAYSMIKRYRAKLKAVE